MVQGNFKVTWKKHLVVHSECLLLNYISNINFLLSSPSCFMLSGNVFMSSNLDLCKNRKFFPFRNWNERVYNFHKDIKQFICAETLLSAIHSRLVRFTVSLLFFIFRSFPLFIVHCQFAQFPLTFFASRDCKFQLVRFCFPFESFPIPLLPRCGKNINNWNRLGDVEMWIHKIFFRIDDEILKLKERLCSEERRLQLTNENPRKFNINEIFCIKRKFSFHLRFLQQFERLKFPTRIKFATNQWKKMKIFHLQMSKPKKKISYPNIQSSGKWVLRFSFENSICLMLFLLHVISTVNLPKFSLKFLPKLLDTIISKDDLHHVSNHMSWIHPAGRNLIKIWKWLHATRIIPQIMSIDRNKEESSHNNMTII